MHRPRGDAIHPRIGRGKDSQVKVSNELENQFELKAGGENWDVKSVRLNERSLGIVEKGGRKRKPQKNDGDIVWFGDKGGWAILSVIRDFHSIGQQRIHKKGYPCRVQHE